MNTFAPGFPRENKPVILFVGLEDVTSVPQRRNLWFSLNLVLGEVNFPSGSLAALLVLVRFLGCP